VGENEAIQVITALTNVGAVGVAAWLFWKAWREERDVSKQREKQVLDAFMQQAKANEKLSNAIEGNTTVITNLVDRFDAVLCPRDHDPDREVIH
jgi:hypothetical protein